MSEKEQISKKKKIRVTWGDVEEYVDLLACEIKRRDVPIAGVYGLPRGGLIFAVMLSHRLSVPLLMHPYGNCLIVDDICDSGRSLVHYKPNDTMFLDTFFISTMFYTGRSEIKPDFYAKELGRDFAKNSWVVFPWEA